MEIRALAEEIYRRVDWTWPSHARRRWPLHGHRKRVREPRLERYNEAMLGLPARPRLSHHTPSASRPGRSGPAATTSTGHALRPDLSELRAPLRPPVHARMGRFPRHPGRYMRDHGLDYFENSRRATYAQRSTPSRIQSKWQDTQECVGHERFRWPRPARESNLVGSPLPEVRALGVAVGLLLTTVPSPRPPPISSLPFAPEIVLPRHSRCIVASDPPSTLPMGSRRV